MMKRLVAISVALGGALTLGQIFNKADAKAAKCLLIVDGVTYINGYCEFEFGGGDGSFSFDDKKLRTNCRGYDPNGPCVGYNTKVTRKGTFGTLEIISPGRGKIYWNYGSSRKAHALIKDVYRDGACWSNSRAKLCAW